MIVTTPAGTYEMRPIPIVNDLIYRNYRFNRLRSPEVTPEEWRVVYGDRVDQLERLFQLEQER